MTLPNNYLKTPSKTRIKGAAEFNNAHSKSYFKTDLFKYYGVGRSQGYEILKNDHSAADRTRNNYIWAETRGRPPKLSSKDLYRVETFLQDQGWDARALTWDQLAEELDLDISGYQLKEHIGLMDYHKCIACQKGWLSQRAARRRVDWAKVMLSQYPDPEDWYRVRFSDEVHWSIGPEGRARIIRKPGERLCTDCIQHTTDRSDEKSFERAHSWAAIGWDFKSELSFYKVEGNRNGKMSLQVYRDQILNPIVKPWIDRGDDFVLEEDGDSGHGTSKSNIVRTWKKENRLESYFNCSNSPDLSPIENCWQPPKQYLKRFPHWDEFETRELAIEGWQSISQSFINERVRSMPQRLRDCIDLDGQVTGY